MDALPPQPSTSPHAYSPERRTALVLCGTGAHGAYHAGVLRALHEGGVKIDVMAGSGVGAAGAAFAAIDGAARLWEAGGLWRDPAVASWYGWRWPVRAGAWISVGLFAVLAIPLLVLGAGLLVSLSAFLLETLGATAGSRLIAGYGSWLQGALAEPRLPTYLPRAVTIGIALLAAVLLAGAFTGRLGADRRRSYTGAWWWRIVAAPLDPFPARNGVGKALRRLIPGADLAMAGSAGLGRRYSEILVESLGQPGFRELMVVATDLDARQDVVAALLRDTFRGDFFGPRTGRERRSETLDLAGVGREHMLDVVMGALTPLTGADPQLIAYAPDSYWRGETHRLSDRPGAVLRLLEELHAAGVRQVIVVAAVPLHTRPHRLSALGLDMHRRLGDALSAAEAAALRDALLAARTRFEHVYAIGPEHNAIGPFDLNGAYDDMSQRHQTLEELMERGYEDAYRQFIEPIVGASGEQLTVN